MKTQNRQLLLAVLCCLAVALTSASAVPLNFQGRLTDDTGQPVNGTVTILIKLFDHANAGTLRYQETVPNVVVREGIYSLLFGTNPDGASPGDLPAALGAPELWAEVAVNGSALTPRQRLACVPYALQALGVANGSLTPDAFEQSPSVTGSGAPTGGGFGTLTGTFPAPFSGVPSLRVDGSNGDFVVMNSIDETGFSLSLQPITRTLVGAGQTSLDIVGGHPAAVVVVNGSLLYMRALDPQGANWSPAVTIVTPADLAPFYPAEDPPVVSNAIVPDLTVINGVPAVAFGIVTKNGPRLGYAVAFESLGTSPPWRVRAPAPNQPVLANTSLSMELIAGFPMIATSDGTLNIYRSSGATGGTGLSGWSVLDLGANYPADTVDLGIVGNHPSIAIRHDDDLYFARANVPNGDTWSVFPATARVDAADSNSTVSLVLFSGNPAIAYSRKKALPDSGGLSLVKSSVVFGTEWGSPIPITSDGVVSSPTMTFVDGRPAIAYRDDSNGDVLSYLHANNSAGTSWPANAVSLGTAAVSRSINLLDINGHAALLATLAAPSLTTFMRLPRTGQALAWTATDYAEFPFRVPDGSITSDSLAPGTLDGLLADANGSLQSQLDSLYVRKSGDTMTGNLSVEGTTTTKILTITGGADIAEPFEVTGEAPVEPGTVVIIDPENPGRLRVSERAYDRRVAGIVSGAGGVRPGMLLQQDGVLDQGVHVALTGRVYVQASTAHGAIQPGDLLTTSDLPGKAARVTDHQSAGGAILGKAMTSLEDGEGLVLVLVSLQ